MDDQNSNADIHVLVVDDNEDNRDIALRHLKRKMGFASSIAVDDGSTALTYIEQHPETDIIFLDRMMPLSGLEFCKIMRQNPAFDHMAILFQTGKVQLEELREVFNANIHHLLKKPYSQEDMGWAFYPLATEIRQQKYFREVLGKDVGIENPTPEKVYNSTEAKEAALAIAALSPQPLKIVNALYQLMMNGLEHGVLHLDERNKALMHERGHYEEQFDALLRDSHAKEYLSLTVDQNDTTLTITIHDPGEGFDPALHLELTPEHLLSPYGKHIAQAKEVLDHLEYNEQGNRVTVRIGLR